MNINSPIQAKIVSMQNLSQNTEYGTRWCITNYEILKKEVKRIKFSTIFLMSPDVIDKWLVYFVAETVVYA